MVFDQNLPTLGQLSPLFIKSRDKSTDVSVLELIFYLSLEQIEK